MSVICTCSMSSSMALVTDHNGDFQLLEASQQQLDHQAHYKTAERSTHCNGPRSGQRAQPLPGTWDDEDSLPDIASPGSSGTEAEWLAKESGDGFCEQTAAAEGNLHSLAIVQALCKVSTAALLDMRVVTVQMECEGNYDSYLSTLAGGRCSIRQDNEWK